MLRAYPQLLPKSRIASLILFLLTSAIAAPAATTL
jgi:hypothetical protein